MKVAAQEDYVFLLFIATRQRFILKKDSRVPLRTSAISRTENSYKNAICVTLLVLLPLPVRVIAVVMAWDALFSFHLQGRTNQTR
jgi:hypothetical protein